MACTKIWDKFGSKKDGEGLLIKIVDKIELNCWAWLACRREGVWSVGQGSE